MLKVKEGIFEGRKADEGGKEGVERNSGGLWHLVKTSSSITWVYLLGELCFHQVFTGLSGARDIASCRHTSTDSSQTSGHGGLHVWPDIP
ncbi:hypothetical protein BgiBS90_008675, partial [Biomphalaria glabrata]